MNQTEFEKLVEEGFLAIPEKFREKIKNVAFLVEDKPSREVLEEEGLGEKETLLGYYHGVPYTERGALYGSEPTLPDTITLFKKPIEEAAGNDPKRIRQIVFDTVWHEIAHHFGFDEQEVQKRENDRGIH